MIIKRKIKAIIFIILLAFASYGYSQTNLIVSLYTSSVVNPILPDGCGFQVQKDPWCGSIRVRYNMYFPNHASFDISFERELGKIFGRLGIHDSMNSRERHSSCSEDGIFPGICEYKKDQLINMLEISLLGHTFNVFKYFYADISLNPGIVFDAYGHGDVCTYFRSPIKTYILINNFAAGLTFDLFRSLRTGRGKNSSLEAANHQVYIGYQFKIFEKSSH